MSSQAPEPWYVEFESGDIVSIKDHNGETLIVGSCEVDGIDNAALFTRIVSCVNACAEAGKSGLGAAADQIADVIREYREQDYRQKP